MLVTIGIKGIRWGCSVSWMTCFTWMAQLAHALFFRKIIWFLFIWEGWSWAGLLSPKKHQQFFKRRSGKTGNECKEHRQILHHQSSHHVQGITNRKNHPIKPFKPLRSKFELSLVAPIHSQQNSGEKLIKYQAYSSCVIMSVILMTTLIYKALI